MAANLSAKACFEQAVRARGYNGVPGGGIMANTSADVTTVSAAEAPFVRVDREGPVVRLTLNRAAKYNVLSAAMMAALKESLEAVAGDRSVRVIVLAAEGRAFCAGHDLNEMGSETSTEEMRALFGVCSQLMMSIRRLSQPVIARVQGVATAAGCQLVAMCDLAVASDDARFAVSGINLGLFCSTPAVALSRNVLQKPALEMLLTGEFIDAPTARERGLVNRVVPQAQLDAEIAALAAQIATKSPEAVALGKRLFYEQLELSIEAAYERASDVMACNAGTEDARRGIARFTKRTP
jgi:enoyl-CoA hydratase/carnithine racemase